MSENNFFLPITGILEYMDVAKCPAGYPIHELEFNYTRPDGTTGVLTVSNTPGSHMDPGGKGVFTRTVPQNVRVVQIFHTQQDLDAADSHNHALCEEINADMNRVQDGTANIIGVSITSKFMDR